MAARATTTTVLVRMGGVYWVNTDATNVGFYCTAAALLTDSYTYPEVLSSVGTKEIELDTDVVMNMIAVNDWASAGGYLSGQPRPVVMTQDIKDTADRLVQGATTTDKTVDMIE